MTYEGDAATEGGGDPFAQDDRPITSPDDFKTQHLHDDKQSRFRGRAIFWECLDKFMEKRTQIVNRDIAMGVDPVDAYTPEEIAGRQGAMDSMGFGGAATGLAVYAYRKRLRLEHRTGAYTLLGIVSGALLSSILGLGRFLRKDVEKVPIKLRRDCPAYFLAAPCAKDEACLEHVRRLRDPYRMMEGYLACSQVRAAKAGNSSHIPPPSEGFVEDDA